MNVGMGGRGGEGVRQVPTAVAGVVWRMPVNGKGGCGDVGGGHGLVRV